MDFRTDPIAPPRRAFTLLLVAAGALAATGMAPGEAARPAAVVVKVEAKRFSYSPASITLRRGVPVVLEFASLDFVHGFKVPDLNLRADLPPGQVTRVAFTPERAGRFEFLCDNFCGSGHEEMNGEIVVVD